MVHLVVLKTWRYPCVSFGVSIKQQLHPMIVMLLKKSLLGLILEIRTFSGSNTAGRRLGVGILFSGQFQHIIKELSRLGRNYVESKCGEY